MNLIKLNHTVYNIVFGILILKLMLAEGLKDGVCKGIKSVPCRPGELCDRYKTVEEEYCCKGYFPVKNKCVKECAEGCRGGICLYNQCLCNNTHILVNHTCVARKECKYGENLNKINECIAICDPNMHLNCSGSKCKTADDCSCIEEYERTTREESCMPKCKNGYIRKNSSCEPYCDPPCLNGICSSPNKCTCNSGFTHDIHEVSKCVPMCGPHFNSTCSKTQCQDNNNNNKTNKCDPITENLCLKKEDCSCLDGYEKNAHNSDCIQIVCKEGYEKYGNSCKPICNTNCTNGVCISPNNCECISGFVFNIDRVCVPFDEQKENSSLSKIICQSGYEVSDKTGICEPTCESSCEHGNCSGTNDCICDEGYENETNMTCNPKMADCDVCQGTCEGDICHCSNNKPCRNHEPDISQKQISYPPSMAAMQWTWIVGGLVVLILLGTIIFLILKSRKLAYDSTAPTVDSAEGVIAYIKPDTLINYSNTKHQDNIDIESDPNETTSFIPDSCIVPKSNKSLSQERQHSPKI